MSVLAETLPGSYKGEPFLIARSNVAGGQKDAKKSFPNSNKQLIEQLGLRPRTYRIDAIMSAPLPVTTGQAGPTDSYINKRDRFLSILEKGGRGVLIHPLYGQIENVVVRDWTIVEDMTSLGDSIVSVMFEISDTKGTPEVASTTIGLVSNGLNTALGAIESDFTDTFGISDLFANNYFDAVGLYEDVAGVFNSVIQTFSVATDTIDSFTNDLNDFAADITTLVTTPQRLIDSVNTLFTSFDNVFTTTEATLDAFGALFDFGDNDVEIVPTTAGRLEKIQNRQVSNGVMQAQSLCYSYFNASQITYTTVEEVEEVADRLEVQYQKLYNSEPTTAVGNTAGDPVALSDDAISAITDLRTIVQDFFNEQKLTAQQIITVRTNEIPVRTLAYQYYGNSTLADQIVELNGDLNVSFYKGDVEILTA